MLPTALTLRLEPGRRVTVLTSVKEGSEPSGPYYVMTAISTLIAASGLIANSAAVIIGAMLVAPLMTPIFGIAMALVRGNGLLLGQALRAEAYGASLAIFLGWLFGCMPLALEATDEMLSRTSPSIIDLLVAILAGAAGAYAMLNERISATLPGVAIATAIVPPLANTGLCLAIGAYAGAMGSFLLFLANLFSILLVAALLFILAGFAPYREKLNKQLLFRRFGIAATGFLALFVYLSYTLVLIVEQRHQHQRTKELLAGLLRDHNGAALDKLTIRRQADGDLDIHAVVLTPSIIGPIMVARLEETLNSELGRDTHLTLRNLTARDVAAPKDAAPDPATANRLHIVEQVIREQTQHLFGFRLKEVTQQVVPQGQLYTAAVDAARGLTPTEVERWQTLIRERTGDPSAALCLRVTETELVTSAGAYLYGFSGVGSASLDEHAEVLDDLRQRLRPIADDRGLRIESLYLNEAEEPAQVLLLILGTRTPNEDDRVAFAESLSDHEVLLWYRPDLVLTPQGPLPFDVVRNRRTVAIERASRKRNDAEIERPLEPVDQPTPDP